MEMQGTAQASRASHDRYADHDTSACNLLGGTRISMRSDLRRAATASAVDQWAAATAIRILFFIDRKIKFSSLQTHIGSLSSLQVNRINDTIARQNALSVLSFSPADVL